MARTDSIKLKKNGQNTGTSAGRNECHPRKAGSQDGLSSLEVDGDKESPPRKHTGNDGGLLEKAEAMDLEATPEEMKFVAKYQEVSKDEIAVETIGALKDRCGNRYQVVRRRRQLKKRTQGDGSSRKKLASARRRITRRPYSAPRSSGTRQGQRCNRSP
jgi:hypothetical protein